MPQQGTAGARVKINGTDVATDAMHAVVIEMDIDQPDMCTATLNNTPEYGFSKNINFGDAVEVRIGESDGGDVTTLFKGEVVGLEPVWDTKGESKCVVRALNKLHKLTHGKKSRTYTKQTDKDIANKIAQDNGLTLDYKGNVNIKYDHVYQHGQSDLEFLLSRAARINYEVMVDDTKLVFRQRDLSVDSGINLEFGNQSQQGEQSLQRFAARLTAAGQVTKVTVRGWDPTQHKEVVGESKGLTTKLGQNEGGAMVKKGFSTDPVHYDHDVPVSTKAEADAIAQSKLEDFALNHILGEAQCKGSPKLKPGLVVTIKSIQGMKAPDDRFAGKYYVTGATHRYTHKGGGGDGGYITLLKLKRNASS